VTEPTEHQAMSDSKTASNTGRRHWYWHAIHADPERRHRFERSLDRARTDAGEPDDMDEIARLLDGRT
jgi:hypothetical protein